MPNGNDKDNNQNWMYIISVVVVGISILIWLCKYMKKSKPKKKEKTSDDEDISIPLIKQTEQPKSRIIKRKARKKVSKDKEYVELDTTPEYAQIPDGYQSVGGDIQYKFEERQYNIGDNQGKPGECLWQILFPYLNTQTINQALVDRGRPQGVRGLLNDAIQQNHRNRWVHIDELQGIINYINQELGAAGIERQIDYGAVEIIYNHRTGESGTPPPTLPAYARRIGANNGGLQLALLGDHNGGYTTRNGGAHWVEAQGTDTLNIEGQRRQGDWNNPSTDLQVRSTTENLEKCITMLQALNNKITHKLLPNTRFTEILKKLKEKSVSIPAVVEQIKQLIVNLKEAHKSNLERILRAQKRALAQKPQKGELPSQFHPIDLRHDKTFEPNKIYLIETPFSQVFMVFTRGGRWMFHNYESAYCFSIGRTNPSDKPFGLPISYDKIAETLDGLDPDLKNQIYQLFKQYVLAGVMPNYIDVTKVKDHGIQPRICGQFSEEVATYAGCLAAAWLLSESGPYRIRVRGKIERAILRSKFDDYGSFSALIKALPQSHKGGVKATKNAIISSIPPEFETQEEKVKREIATRDIEQVPQGDFSSSSDDEESVDFQRQIEKVEKLLEEVIKLLK